VAIEGLTRRDYQGIPESTTDWLKSIVTSPMPSQVTRMLPEGWGKSESDNKLWDDFINTIGLRERHYFTPLEKEIRNLYYERNPRGKQSENQKNRTDIRREIYKIVEKSDTPLSQENVNKITKLINDNVDNGKITLYQGQDLLDNVGGESKDINVTMYNRLPIDDKVALYEKMSDEEKKIYKAPRGVDDSYTKQLNNLKANHPDQYKILRDHGLIQIPRETIPDVVISDKEKITFSEADVDEINKRALQYYVKDVIKYINSSRSEKDKTKKVLEPEGEVSEYELTVKDIWKDARADAKDDVIDEKIKKKK
jgi:polyhydroxyalkanoate synthesis regulator phasin